MSFRVVGLVVLVVSMVVVLEVVLAGKASRRAFRGAKTSA